MPRWLCICRCVTDPAWSWRRGEAPLLLLSADAYAQLGEALGFEALLQTDRAGRWICGCKGPQRLAVLQETPQLLAFDVEPLGGFLDGQAFANDQAYRGPVEGGFSPGVVMRSHISCQVAGEPRLPASRSPRASGSPLNTRTDGASGLDRWKPAEIPTAQKIPTTQPSAGRGDHAGRRRRSRRVSEAAKALGSC